MLSKLIPNVSLADHTMTSSVAKKQNSPRPGELIKLYISELMTEIQRSEATISTTVVNGSNIFINDPKCKPTTKTTLKTQNYISVICGKNANWDGIDDITKDGSGNIIKRELPYGLVVQCDFLSGILVHGMVETKRDLIDYDDSNGKNTSTIYSGDMRHVLVYDPEEIGVLSEHVDDLIRKLQKNKIVGEL